MPNVEGSSLRFNLWMSAGTAHNSRNESLGFQAPGSVFDFAMMQIEYGQVATPFEVLHPGASLALCQRYCQVLRNFAGNPFAPAFARLATQLIVPVGFSQMRQTPAAFHTGALTAVLAGTGFNATATTAVAASANFMYYTLTVSGAPSGASGYVYATPGNDVQTVLDAEI